MPLSLSDTFSGVGNATSLGSEVPFSTLLETYGLRWRIEVIFKAWKSNMNFHVIHRVSALELSICLTAKLVSITSGMGHLYQLCYDKRKRLNDHQKQRNIP